MKKILLGLISFIIILVVFNIFVNTKIIDDSKTVEATKWEYTYIPVVDEDYIIENKKDFAPITIDNETNFVTSWYTQSTDGNVVSESDFINQNIYVYSTGSDIKSNSLFRDGIALKNQNVYTIGFSSNSSVDRDIVVSLENADTGYIYCSQDFHLSNSNDYFEFSYKMDQENTWNARLAFYFGNNGINDEHQINFNHITITNTTEPDYTVKVNQLGYTTDSGKRLVVSYNEGDYFRVVNMNNEIVYEGALVNRIDNVNTKEINYYGDFTNLLEPGRYKIITQIGGESRDFIIGDNIYSHAFKDIFRFFSIQRCGSYLDNNIFGKFSHDECHNDLAIVYDDNSQIDVTGGWHDAGDFGRYVQTGTKAVNDLLLAYIYNPNVFSDEMNIAESNNGISDVLDEVRYEIEWLFKMQRSDGGVYNKVLTQNLPGDISPSDDNQSLYVLPVETTATGDFVGTLALAYTTYKDIDNEFANECLDKALLSWNFLVNNGQMINISNPEGINGGLYRDDSDIDERFFAAMSLYYATNDMTYLTAAIDLYNSDNDCSKNISYTNVGGYGRLLYLMSNDDSIFREEMINSLVQEAEEIMSIAINDGYNTSIYNYNWGSNGDIVNNGIILVQAYDYSNNKGYLQMAYEQLNYVFGKNSLNISFVSGYGYNCSNHPHHRISKANNAYLKGALVGGVNSNREDQVTIDMGSDIPNAKIYVDKYESYSTNEVAIYWNSALIYLMASLNVI